MPASRIACLWPDETTPREYAVNALADVAAGFSPAVERGDSAVYLEVGDLGRLFPSEELLLTALRTAVTEIGVGAAVAVASNKAVARTAARAQGLGLCRAARDRGGSIVPRGGERAALAALPIAALGPPPALLAQIEIWGLRTVGELAALPRPAVVTRLGAAGAVLHRLAWGESDELLHPTPPPLELREEQELLDALDNLEPLLFVLRGLLERLVARLRARGQACSDLTLHLGFSGSAEESRRIAVATPMQKSAPLLELLRVSLDVKPPRATVERLALSTTPARPRPMQLDLFAPPGPAPERLATTLARLEALCGSGRVGRPVMPDSHAPSAAELCTFAPPAAATRKETETPAPPLLLSARVLRPPRPVRVARCGAALAEVHLDFRPAGPASTKGKACPVRRAGGPYRLCDVRGTRDYYDVELGDGDLYRLFHDLTADRWFLDAVYD